MLCFIALWKRIKWVS